MIAELITKIKEILPDINQVYGSVAPVNAVLPYIVVRKSYTDQHQTKDSCSAALTRVKTNIFYSQGTESGFTKAWDDANLLRQELNAVTDVNEYRITEISTDYEDSTELDFVTMDIEIYSSQQ